MAESRRSVPSTAQLTAFAAAARIGSFTGAAEELGVTQAAISRQIRDLEGFVGGPLFERRHRDVVTTPTGSRLLVEIAPALARIADAVGAARAAAADAVLTVFAHPGLAGALVMPRIGPFEAAHPGATVRLISSSRPIETVSEPIDLGLQYGSWGAQRFESRPIADDVVYPVAAPGLLAHLGPVVDAEIFARARLLEMAQPGRKWLDWRAFLQSQELPSPRREPTARFDSYAAVLKAAEEGQGLALGWDLLVREAIRRGQLVRVGHWSAPEPDAICAYLPRGRAPRSEALALIEWFVEQPES